MMKDLEKKKEMVLNDIKVKHEELNEVLENIELEIESNGNDEEFEEINKMLEELLK